MITGGQLGVVTAFLLALLAALTLTPAVRFAARRFGFVASPKTDRWHTKPTALMGGVAIYAAILVGIAGTMLVTGDMRTAAAAFRGPALGVMLAATIMFGAGLVDDIVGMRPTSKLILQAAGAAVAISFGVIYPLTPWVPVNILATVFWFIALTNALNLLDNMDGVAAGVAGLAGLFLAATFAFNGSWQFAMVCAALAGAAAGFLRYNFHPSSIFMGDSGSLVLGALIASLGAAFPATAAVGIVPVLFVPVFIAAIPILDTLLVTTTRTVAGHPISQGGRDHTSHRLVALGLSERQVALLMYSFAALGGMVALGLGRAGAALSGWAGMLFLVGLGIFAAYLGRMHAYQPGQDTMGRRVTTLVSDLLHKRRALEVLVDIGLFAAAYYGAYVLRWDGLLPDSQRELLGATLALAIACKSIAFGVTGAYRGLWHYMTLPDLHRLVRASALGSLLLVAMLVLFFRTAEFARAIIVLDLLLVTVLTCTARLSFRSLDMLHRTLRPNGARTLIYGAGSGGQLFVRELMANPARDIIPVGFLDDDPTMHDREILGLRVLGTGDELLELIVSKGVSTVIVTSRELTPHAAGRVERAQRTAAVEIWQFVCELAPYGGDGARPPVTSITALPRATAQRGSAAPETAS